MSKLAQNLTVLRKNNKLVQDDIAKKVYVSRQAVSKWERGESEPDIDTLAALSELYGVTIDDIVKKDLTASEAADSCAKHEKNLDKLKHVFDQLKYLHRSQTVKTMTIWAILLLAGYALMCGIIQTALFDTVTYIWLIWFTLPIVPPIIFAIRFRHEIGKKWIMFFVDVPFIAGLIYLVIHFATNSDGAWLAFLLIPVYYAAAVAVCVHQFRLERTARKNDAADDQ